MRWATAETTEALLYRLFRQKATIPQTVSRARERKRVRRVLGEFRAEIRYHYFEAQFETADLAALEKNESVWTNDLTPY